MGPARRPTFDGLLRPGPGADIQGVTFRQFLRGLLALAVMFMSAGTTGDPDLWGHVRFGQDILAQGAVRLADTYSFTADRAWVNHEWLSEVLMALAFRAAGGAGLNLLRIAVILGVLALVWRGAAEVADRMKMMMLVACAVGIYMRAHPIRPQLFSLLLFTVLLAVMHHADARRTLRPLAWVPLVMAAWVNFHGGWVVGLGYFAMWCGARGITSTTRERVSLAVALVVSIASTLLNPYGTHMWAFLVDTVRFDRPMIGDWQPLHLLPPLLWVSWITAFSILAAAAWRARSRADWRDVGMAAVLGVMAMRVSRIDAFFAIAAVFAAARVFSEPAPIAAEPQQRRSPVLAVAFGTCVLAMAVALVPRISTVRVPDHLMPDAEVAAYARDQRLKGHVLTWFNWGEYLIWHFGPDLKVSMDGRRETVYSAGVVDAHMRFYTGTSEGWRYADALHADYVWIPKDLPVVRDLQMHGWRALCRGNQSILLARNAHVPECSQHTVAGAREFPRL